MAKKQPDTMSVEARRLLEEKLDTLVRALAIEAASEDHRKALRKTQKKKGGRPKKAD